MQPTLRLILFMGYATFEQAHRLPEFVREAAHCIMACRSAVLGGVIFNRVLTVTSIAYGITPVNTVCAPSVHLFKFSAGLLNKKPVSLAVITTM